MKFEELAQTFKAGAGGTDQFKAFYKSAFQLMKADPANAALYFVVAVAAHNYVLKYEDQAVPPALATFAKDKLDEYNSQLVSALRAGGEARLAACSAVSIDYEWNVNEF